MQVFIEVHVASQAAAPLRFVEAALKHRGNVRVMPLAHCFCNPM